MYNYDGLNNRSIRNGGYGMFDTGNQVSCAESHTDNAGMEKLFV